MLSLKQHYVRSGFVVWRPYSFSDCNSLIPLMTCMSTLLRIKSEWIDSFASKPAKCNKTRHNKAAFIRKSKAWRLGQYLSCSLLFCKDLPNNKKASLRFTPLSSLACCSDTFASFAWFSTIIIFKLFDSVLMSSRAAEPKFSRPYQIWGKLAMENLLAQNPHARKAPVLKVLKPTLKSWSHALSGFPDFYFTLFRSSYG